MSDLSVVIWFGTALLALLAILLLRRGRGAPVAEVPTPPPVPRDAILVDGSNVMHWGGEPSVLVLQRVVDALQAQGLEPFVCFDANVGYKLWGAWKGPLAIASEIGVPAGQIYVVDKGVVADGVLLDLATEHGLQVVTNDRFRDWAGQFPWVKDYRRFRRGYWADGNVVWRT